LGSGGACVCFAGYASTGHAVVAPQRDRAPSTLLYHSTRLLRIACHRVRQRLGGALAEQQHGCEHTGSSVGNMWDKFVGLVGGKSVLAYYAGLLGICGNNTRPSGGNRWEISPV
jgi:hypothetical protein